MATNFDPYYLWLGIPPSEQPPNHYRLLGLVLFECNAEVISQAADRQMAFVQMHKAGPHSSQSQRLLNELSSARLCLLNEARKAGYDEELRRKLAPPPPPPVVAPPPVPAPPPVTGRSSSIFGAPTTATYGSPEAPSLSSISMQAPPSFADSASWPPYPSASVGQPVKPGVVPPLAEPSRPPAVPLIPPAWQTPAIVGASVGVVLAVGLAAIFFAPSNRARVSVEETKPKPAPVAPSPEPTATTTAEPISTIGATPRPATTVEATVSAPTPATAPLVPLVAGADGGMRWPPAVGYEVQPIPMNGASGPVVAETEGFAALLSMRGALRSRDEEIGLYLLDRAWTPVGRRKEESFGGDVLAVRSPWQGATTREYRWNAGQPPVEMISAREGFCVLAGVSGKFAGAGQWAKVDIDENGRWRLHGGDGWSITARAIAVTVPLWTGEVAFAEWSKFGQPIPLLGVDEGFCYLTGVGGRNSRAGEGVAVRVENGKWILHGQSSFDTTVGTAAIVRLNRVAPTNGSPGASPSTPPLTASRAAEMANTGTSNDPTEGAAPSEEEPFGSPTSPAPRSLADLAADAELDSSAAPKAKRWEPPKGKDLSQTEQAVKDSFGGQINGATTPGQKANAARLLLTAAKQGGEPQDKQYALLQAARKLALEAKETTLGWQVCDELGRLFEMNVVSLKAEALTAGAQQAKTSDDAKIVTQAWVTLLNEALAADDYVIADRCTDRAEASARKAGDDVLRKKVLRGREDVKVLTAAYEQVKAQREQLAADPNNAEAAGAWGRFLCLYKGDFAQGIVFLAKGTGPAAEAAKAELASPTDAATRRAVGDQWWTLIEAEAEPLPKRFAMQRAAAWYRRAVPDATGLGKKELENRITEYDRAYPVIPYDEWSDVLGMIDLNRHVLAAKWHRDGADVATDDQVRDARCAAPVSALGSYELRAKFIRRDRSGGVRIAFPVGSGYAEAAFSRNGDRHALLNLKHDELPGPDSSSKPGALVNGREYTADIKVVVAGERATIEVLLEGRRVARWEGPVASLDPRPSGPTQPGCIVIGTFAASATFRELQVRVRDGEVRLGTK